LLNTIKNSSKYLGILSVILMLSACGNSGNTGDNNIDTGADQLISAQVIDNVPPEIMLKIIKANIDQNATNAFGYRAVKIIYNTKGQNNEDIKASGLLIVPSVSAEYKAYLASIGKSFSVSMVCDNHGTIFKDDEAPTNVEVMNGLPDSKIGIVISGYAGFAAILPDYIGYGESNDIAHPYIMKEASAQASLDMIKASMKYMDNNDITLNYQLYISGYSEGGYTAMALAEKVENSFSDRVNLMGVAPMAGPYNVEALGDIEIDADHIMIYPAFLAYLSDSYSYYYDDLNLENIVNTTDTNMFHSLFDGTKSGIEIQMSLGLTTNYGFASYPASTLFQESFINDYKNNVNSSIRVRFQENATDNWIPHSKFNLIQCVDDEIIPFSQSKDTYAKFLKNGVDVTLTPIPTELIPPASKEAPFVHARCASVAYGAAITWFNAIRLGEIK